MREPYNITFNQHRNTVAQRSIQFVVGDYMTCPLAFKWMKNDLEAFNHTGTKIYLVVKTPSGKSIDDRVTINDPDAGVSNMLLKQDFITEVGLHQGELQAVDIESGIVRMTSPPFSYSMRGSLQNSDTEEAKNVLTQLQEALEAVANLDIDFKIGTHNTEELAHPHLQQELADLTTQSNEITTVELPKKANKKQEDWITATLQNGWTGNMQYRKNEFNTLEFSGTIAKNGGDVADTILFTLASGYRPGNSIRFDCNSYSTSEVKAGVLGIETNGNVLVKFNSVNANISLYGKSIVLG